MKKHLISVHPEKKDKPFEFFQKLRDTFQKRATLMHMVRERPLRLDDGIVASYKVSKLIAKTSNAHSIDESLILPAASIIISDVMKLAPEETVQAIPLSNSTVCRRIDEMAGDIEDQLICLPGSRTSSPVQNVHDKKLRRKGPRDKWSRAKLPMRQMVHGKNVH
ncbi:hypothetical protein M513_02490 [Trichuris suis]|nr:hypothetical protein M513_02490 [Trichuris suis]